MQIKNLVKIVSSNLTQTPVRDPLTFTAAEAGSTVKLVVRAGTPAEVVMKVSVNGGDWTNYTIGDVITLTNVGDIVSFESTTTTLNDCVPSGGSYNGYKFVMTGKINASGNIMSLINYSSMKQVGTFRYLFENCTALITPPELPATALTTYCYGSLFFKCTNLTVCPKLPAKVIASCAYAQMFEGCTALTQVPELIADKLNAYAYYRMFYGCINLSGTVKLSIKNTTTFGYLFYFMFSGCTKIDTVCIDFPDMHTANNMTTDWLKNVAASGVIYKPESLVIPEGTSGLPSGWTTSSYEDYAKENTPLTFKAVTANSVVSLTLVGSVTESVNLYFKYNDKEWLPYTLEKPIILQNVNDTVQFKNLNNTLSKDSNNYYKFVMSGSISSSGNVNSLINYGSLSNYCFYGLFWNCTSLIEAPEKLFSTTLADHCYTKMFQNTRITRCPEMPALILEANCYQQMYANCSSLTQTPVLPATTLANGCYFGMFAYTKITTPPELPVMELKDSCYSNMFEGCSLLTVVPALPATVLKNSCYKNMFYACKKITASPELVATTLVANCYFQMFYNCVALTSITVKFTSIVNNALTNWVYGVSASGTFTKPQETTLDTGVNGIPENWTIINTDNNAA